MQTTAIRTVAKSLPQNKVILLTCLISNSYIPYTDLHKIFLFIPISAEKIKANTPMTLLHFPLELDIKTFKEQKQTTLP
ncbi:hypothetical protein DWY21_17040 [Phocaeicola plebeius]|uniref:Uncharacterized protein n=1 Tax=Phocaeicola plebeius TaxID=310297 RepID=A0A412H1E9_9BACT|nr:hypothetical protein DWY21_17040 [Phocaeicola plebeius]RGS01697.1 hypothetical protein DWY14_16980 [Phocaeicola plebeius]